MKPKAYIKTFGCQMNEHDTFQMQNVLERDGYAMTDEPGDAELILLNTCSVRQNPENKVYSFLGSIREHKQERPGVIIAVGGCVAQQEGETILKREKTVDLVFGPDNVFRLPEMLAEVKRGARVCDTRWMPRERKIQNFIPEEWIEHGHVEGVKAYISITKGCNNNCTFCIVPTTRGREVSREKDNIVREAEALVRNGAKEIWLLGQNVNSYQGSSDYRFYNLLDELSQIEGLYRIRFTSPHPKDWNNALSDLMAERKAICKQLHLPFQAGSDSILHAMRRNHTLDEYIAKVRYLQQVAPTVELSTDLIVGFPGESEEDFERTLHCLREVGFAQVFAFKYSRRPGTPASDMDDNVPREVKEERLARAITLQREIMLAKQPTYVGTVQEVLIDGAHNRKRGWMNGRTDSFLPIMIEDSTLEIGDIVQARVISYQSHWLVGERLASAS